MSTLAHTSSANMRSFLCCRCTGGSANTCVLREKGVPGYCGRCIPLEVVVGLFSVLAFSCTLAALGTTEWVVLDATRGAEDFSTNVGLYRAEDVRDFSSNSTEVMLADDDAMGMEGAGGVGFRAVPDGGIVDFKCNQNTPSGNAKFYLGLDEDTCGRLSGLTALLVLAFIFVLLGGTMWFVNGIMVRTSRAVKLPSASFLLGLAAFFLLIAVAITPNTASMVKSNYEDALDAMDATDVSVEADTGLSFDLLASAFVFSVVAAITSLWYGMNRSCSDKTSWAPL